MDASWLHIVLLGIVEGITEFLPISSTGHLIVVSDLLGRTSDSDKLFEVVIQLGAIGAVAYEYRRRLWQMACHINDAKTQRMIINLLLAFLPAAIVGLLFYPYIKMYLFSVQTVAIALIIGGIAIIVIEKNPRPPRIHHIDELRPKDALAIGFCQMFALFPGVSRAGATILGAILWGVQRKSATEFSFLLALPTMIAASGYDLIKNRHLLNFDIAADIALGFTISFICALVVIRMLLRYISTHDFTWFGWYRIVFGIIVLALFTP